MRPSSRFPDEGSGKKPRRGSGRAGRPSPKSKPRRKAVMLPPDILPPDMIQLGNGRIVRKGEFVVFVRLRSGGDGIYILSEDLIYLPPDLDVAEIEIDRGIALDSPLVLHPEEE